MKRGLFALILVLGVMVGCTKENEHKEKTDTPSLEIIDVSIQTPETITSNEEVNIQALVIQGSDKVNDADEVKFEFWKVGQEKHETQIAQNDGNGLYSIKKTFTEEGQFIVIAHVTARSMHSMPKKEFVVSAPK